jgi:hypothetical protein
VWWAALHLLLLATTLCLHGPRLATIGGIALIATHAVARYPRTAPRIVLTPDGVWSIPELGLACASLDPRTRYTTFWVRLSLVAARRRVDVVLLFDQLEPEVWRGLQVLLRRGAGTDGARRTGGFRRGSSDLR